MSSIDEISDRAWAALAPHLAGKAGDVGRTGADNRLFLNAVFWVARHGCAWRTLPARFGKHDTLRKRRRRWAQKGTWQRLFEAVQEPDVDWVMRDSTGCGPARKRRAAKKKSRRGRSPRPQPGRAEHQSARAGRRAGQPVAHRARARPASRLPADLLAAAAGAGNVLADKACDTNAVAAAVEALGAQVVVPSKKNRTVVRLIDRDL